MMRGETLCIKARQTITRKTIASRRGRIVKTTGDGMKPLIFIALVVIAVAVM
jgi:hypothetical protein